ncbi:hypothetical protein HETIRDRAFT_313801 [Heterobasidion irregulare TC 32-1]|uniref:J domain-containing protein n=1 Tax=Heterobasidion irregulare (strain TC 32-1) TaxID=747525 RepID=W4KEB9_HETIT|nr:uncharacterized protein HETIRDRAFT_313801 [Heterobasidion irregulare TC 32-1]ETW84197.1 hypothetical protein HETIRDRAFT_313801 [Heterobasidion irregulare TC 32-1]
MDDQRDPAALFFGSDSVDLYATLTLSESASSEEIKRAYRKLALIYHPDKHATKGESAKADASLKFQQIGFAYAVLSDEKKRNRYDRTGKTDEGFDLGPGEDGWEAYFEELFDRVTREKLDQMKKEYQGSTEETEDLKKAYLNTDGSIDEIMNHIPHSRHEDEPRFVILISSLITEGVLPTKSAWESSTKDEKRKVIRKKQADKEAEEAEEMARELGLWDEFYGSGKPGTRKGKAKGTGKEKKEDEDEEDEEDHSALQALILKKKKNTDSFIDNLAAKYAELPPRGKGKGKRKAGLEEVEDVAESPKKRRRGAAVHPPDIDDNEFEKLQQKLFGDKPKSSGEGSTKNKKGRIRKGK